MVCRPTCVSRRKMASLSRELRLMKGTLEQLCSRFELLLDEMGEMRFSDEVERALATLRAPADSPLLAVEIGEDAPEPASDAGALSGVDHAAVALEDNEDDFWRALQAAVAEAPEFEEAALAEPAFEQPAQIHTGMASGTGEANERPAIDPSAARDTHSQPDPSAAARSAVALPTHASSLAVALAGGAASVEMAGAFPAPIDVNPPCERNGQSAARRWSRYAALAALIAAIVVMALFTRGYADFLLKIER